MGQPKISRKKSSRRGGREARSKGHANAVIYARLTEPQRTPWQPLCTWGICCMQLRAREGGRGGGKREANRAVVAGNGVSDAHSLASCSDPQPKRQTDTQARLLGLREGKGKTKAERIAGNRIAFLSFITRNGKQRNYHLTHSSGNGKGVWKGGWAVKGAANLSIKKRTKVFRCCCCCVARWQNCKMATSRCRRRVWSETRAETNWGSWRAIKQGGERGRKAAKQQANGAFGKNTENAAKCAVGNVWKFPAAVGVAKGGAGAGKGWLGALEQLFGSLLLSALLKNLNFHLLLANWRRKPLAEKKAASLPVSLFASLCLTKKFLF